MKALLVKVGIAMLPGGLLVVVAYWLRVRWLRRAAAADAARISAPVVKFGKAEPDQVEAMRAGALYRRQLTDGKRREAAQIATGQAPVEDRLRIVRGR